MFGFGEVAEDVFHFAFEMKAAGKDDVGVAEGADVAGGCFVEMGVGAGTQQDRGVDVVAADLLHEIAHHSHGGDGMDVDFCWLVRDWRGGRWLLVARGAGDDRDGGDCGESAGQESCGVCGHVVA